PFVDASEAGKFFKYFFRTIKKMARDGGIPPHPFGSGARKRWDFLLSELSGHLWGEGKSAPGEAGGDKKKRRGDWGKINGSLSATTAACFARRKEQSASYGCSAGARK